MNGFSDLDPRALLNGKTVCLCGAFGMIRDAISGRFTSQGAHMLDLRTETEEDTACSQSVRMDSLVFLLPPLQRIPLEETSLETFDRFLEEGPMHAWRSIRRFLPDMMSRREGTIVLVGSDLAMEGDPFTAGYAASAGALDALVRAVAMDVCRFGVRCNGILAGMNIAETGEVYKKECPRLAAGDFKGLQPVPRRGTPQDVADAALFLASGMSGFMTGESIPVNGGIQAVAHV